MLIENSNLESNYRWSISVIGYWGFQVSKLDYKTDKNVISIKFQDILILGYFP